MDDTISRAMAIESVCTMLKNCFNATDEMLESVKITVGELPPAERGWIPCSERLPKQGQEVICQCRANMIKVLKLDADGDWYQDAEHCYMSGFVIAWMPLPDPYKESEEDIQE